MIARAARRRSPSRDRAASAPPPRACASASAASVVRLHSSMPSQPPRVVERRPAVRRARSGAQAAGTSMCPPRENGCAAKPTPPAARTASAISRADRPACAISRRRRRRGSGPAFGLTSRPDEHERRRRAGPPSRRGEPPASRDRSEGARRRPRRRRGRRELVDRRCAVGVGASARAPRRTRRPRAAALSSPDASSAAPGRPRARLLAIVGLRPSCSPTRPPSCASCRSALVSPRR